MTRGTEREFFAQRALGGGVDLDARPFAPDDQVRIWIVGEAYPRIVLDPVAGVLTGNGTVAPSALGSGGGSSDNAPVIVGALASRPAAGGQGRLYYANDAGGPNVLYAEGASSWTTLSYSHNDLLGLTTGDPHTQYQLKSARGAANGYASLDASALVPLAQIPSLSAIYDLAGAASTAQAAAIAASLGLHAQADDAAKLGGVVAANYALVSALSAYVQATRQVASGTGLTGGGDLSADRTIALAAIADQRLFGNVSGGSAAPVALTAAQVKTLLAIATADVSGLGTIATRTAPAGTVVGTSDTQTLTNKRITRRVVVVSGPGGTPTTNTDNCDVARFAALATAITSMTTNLSGSPADGEGLIVEFIDNGTARAITWGAKFTATTVALPTTTVISTRLRVGFLWDSTNTVWNCVAVA